MKLSDQPSVVPLRAGQNYAPAKPILGLGEKSPKTHYLCDALKERFEHYYKADDHVWREMISAGERVAKITQGDHLVERNPFTGGWLVVKPARQDYTTKRALNFSQFYVTSCLYKWGLSNPDVVAKAGRDDDRSESAARGASVVGDFYESRFYTPWFTYQEGLSALTFGTYIERLRYDPGIRGAVGLREVVENRDVRLGSGVGYCGDCGYAGGADEFYAPAGDGQVLSQACPQCRSESVLVENPESEQIPTVVGQEEVQLGEFVLDQLPFSASRWDLRRRAEDSSWFIFQQRASLGVIRAVLGDVRLPGSAGDFDAGLDLARRLAYSGQAVEGRSRAASKRSIANDDVNLAEMWLSPDDYSDITIKGDEETIGGQDLPKGANLADLFPEGLVAVGLNGMKTVLGVYSEKHSDWMASGVWHMKVMSGAGRGVTDLVEVQERFNQLDSQQLKYMDVAASPATLIDKNLLSSDEGDYIGTAGANVYLDLSQSPDIKRIQDAVHQLMPASVPGQFVQYVQQFLTQAFATTSHQIDFTNGGGFNVANDTARGAMIADQNANSLFAPLLTIKGEVRKSIYEKVVRAYREYFPIERYFPLGGSTGKAQGVWLSGADLNGEVVYSVVRESELPESVLTKQDKVMSFFTNLFGGFEGYLSAKQVAPLEVQALARLWNVQTDTDTGVDTSEQICRRRLDQVRKMFSAGIVDPTVLVSTVNPPISVFEKAHEQKALWYQDWLDQDEGLDAAMEERMAVEFLIQTHFQLGGMQGAAIAGQSAMVASAGTPPEQSTEGKKK